MEAQINDYPSLTKSYKNFYPFKIGTTSFIYPDLYVPNVKMLGPFVDEIELLLFESAPVTFLFSKAVIDELKQLSQDFQVTYNIHLPTDMSISDPDPTKQLQAIDSILHITDRLAPLSPSTYTLHVPCSNPLFDADQINKWQEIVFRNLGKILNSELPEDKLSIETLNYPFELIEPVISEYNLSVCLDIGHLIVYGHDIHAVYHKNAERISIIHLHGVENDNDHLPLDRLRESKMDFITGMLKRFSGTLSLEVFRYDHLKTSLEHLARHWSKSMPLA